MGCGREKVWGWVGCEWAFMDHSVVKPFFMYFILSYSFVDVLILLHSSAPSQPTVGGGRGQGWGWPHRKLLSGHCCPPRSPPSPWCFL